MAAKLYHVSNFIEKLELEIQPGFGIINFFLSDLFNVFLLLVQVNSSVRPPGKGFQG